MKTVTVKCDFCLNIIAQHDVMTGVKWFAEYDRYELNIYGNKGEFCSMKCLESLIHEGENETKNPVATTAGAPLPGMPVEVKGITLIE